MTNTIQEIIEDLEYRNLFCAHQDNSTTEANNTLINFIYSTYQDKTTTLTELKDYITQAKEYIDVNFEDMYYTDYDYTSKNFLQIAILYCDNAELLKLLHKELNLNLNKKTCLSLEEIKNIADTDMFYKTDAYKNLTTFDEEYEDSFELTALHIAKIANNFKAFEYLRENNVNDKNIMTEYEEEINNTKSVDC